MFCANLRCLILPCLLALLLAGPAHAQILFGSLIQSPDGPIGALFEVNNGSAIQAASFAPGVTEDLSWALYFSRSAP